MAADLKTDIQLVTIGGGDDDMFKLVMQLELRRPTSSNAKVESLNKALTDDMMKVAASAMSKSGEIVLTSLAYYMADEIARRQAALTRDKDN